MREIRVKSDLQPSPRIGLQAETEPETSDVGFRLREAAAAIESTQRGAAF